MSRSLCGIRMAQGELLALLWEGSQLIAHNVVHLWSAQAIKTRTEAAHAVRHSHMAAEVDRLQSAHRNSVRMMMSRFASDSACASKEFCFAAWRDHVSVNNTHKIVIAQWTSMQEKCESLAFVVVQRMTIHLWAASTSISLASNRHRSTQALLRDKSLLLLFGGAPPPLSL